jgi:hypothetical protein
MAMFTQRNKLSALLVPALLVLFAPTGFAADKFDITASEVFDPFGFLGGSPVGALLSPPTVHCPGHEPTGNPEQPCPGGSRTHLRNTVIISRVDSTVSPNFSGDMTVVLNSNLDADFAGPVWGTFSLALDSGGTWEGTWQGLRVRAEEQLWTATLHVMGKGFGGNVDGMHLMVEDEIVSPSAVLIVYTGSIEGRVVDPN